MKQCRWRILLFVVVPLAVALTVYMVVRMRSQAQDEFVMSVNGERVEKEEFFLLLHENTAVYENELCARYGVHAHDELMAELEENEAEYRRLLAEENVACMTRTQVEQQLAEDCGLIENVSWQWLLQQVEKENQTRAEKISRGEPVYGLREFSIQQYYSYFMSNLKLRLLEVLPEEMLAVSEQEIDTYYKNLPYFAHLEGERIYYTLYDVTGAMELSASQQETLYDDIRENLINGKYRAVEAGGITFTPEKVVFGPEELRNFVRQDLESEFLLSLAPGEVTEVFTLGGHSYIAQYHGFDKAEQLTEAERNTFCTQLKKQKYEELLSTLQERAEVTVNSNVISVYIKGEVG